MSISKEKILLFENDKQSIYLIKRIIEAHFPGKQLLTYSPDKHALSLCLSEQPDTIIIETFTTGIYGFKLIKEIKEHERLQGIPLIALSEGSLNRSHTNTVLGTEVAITLDKPLSEDLFISTLRLCLRIRSLEKVVPQEVRSVLKLLEEKESELKDLRYKRSHTEQALLIERDFANQMLDAVGQGLTISDSNGYFQFANPAFCKMIGYDVGDVLGRSPFDFTLGESHHELKKARIDRDTGDTSSYELKMKHKNGHIIDVNVIGVPFYRADRIMGSIAVITDITQYKVTENRLKQISMEHEQIFNATHDAVFLVKVTDNNTFKYISNNRAHQEKTGISLEMIAGKSPVEVLGEKIGRKVIDNYNRCIKEGKTISYEEEIKLKNIHKWYKTTLTPVYYNGKVNLIIGTNDISEKKKAVKN